MIQSNANVSIVRVSAIRFGIPDEVVIDVKRVGDGGVEQVFAGMTMPLIYLWKLTGRYPAVGAAYKVVTSPGQW